MNIIGHRYRHIDKISSTDNSESPFSQNIVTEASSGQLCDSGLKLNQKDKANVMMNMTFGKEE